MNQPKLASTVGIAGCLTLLAVLAWPYFVEPVANVNQYYTTGTLTPLAAGLLALVCAVVFAAGREERSDPATVAGAALVFGVFVLVITVAFALTARVDVLGSGGAALSSQRWLLAGAGAVVTASAAWYVRAIGLF